MAPNSISYLSTIFIFISFASLTFSSDVKAAQKYQDEQKSCYRPRCYHFLRTNSSNVIKVRLSDSTGRTVFCYEGLKQSFFYVFSNPVLRTVKQYPPKLDEVIQFVSFYGSSKTEAEQRSDATVNALLQNWITSIQSVKQTEYFSLSAFNTSCIVIQSNVDYTAGVELKVIDFWFISYLIIGAILFFSAKTWSRNTKLHLGAGVSLGVLASILIFLYVLSRFLPNKLKSVCYLLMAMGTSASLWALQSVTDIVSEPMLNNLMLYWHYVLGYLLGMGLLSFAIVYRYGPVTDARTINLIQWLLQFIGLILIYNGTQIREVSVALIIVVLALYNIPRVLLSTLFNNQSGRNLWYSFFPPKVKLLTEAEYIQQGNIHTRDELEKLRDYCRSPDCKAWKVIGRLNSPHRFADFITNGVWHVSEEETARHMSDSHLEPPDSDTQSEAESELVFVLGNPNIFADFIEGNSWHVSNEELLDYDSDPDPQPSHLLDDDNDDGDLSEADFMLSSP